MTQLGTSILRACAAAAATRPGVILAATLLLTVLAGYASSSLTLDTSTDNILSAELPFRQIEDRYRAAFPDEDFAIVVVDSPAAGSAQAAATKLVERLRRRPDLFSQAALLGSPAFLDRHGLLFLPAEQIESLGERLRPARRLLTTLAADPSLRGLARILRQAEGAVAEGAAPPEMAGFLADLAAAVAQNAAGDKARLRWAAMFGIESGGGTRRLVQAQPVLDDASLDRAGAALAALQADMTAVRSEAPGVTLRATGLPVLQQRELNDVFSGALYASGLSFVLVALSLALGIRSGRLIAALLITLVIGSIWTAGLAAIAVGRLNLISVAFLVLFFGLGVDFGTHLGLRHLEEARKGRPFREALTTAMVGEGAGITLSALCAALAFLAFVPTAYVGLAEFGIISALGMAVAVAVTFTVQPALMALMPPRPKPGTPLSIGIGRWIERYHRAILIAAGLVTLGAIGLSTQARLDVDPLNLQNPEADPVVAFRELADDPETSPYALNVLAPDMESAGALAESLQAVEGVGGVRWIGNFVPDDQPAKLQAIAAVRARLGETFFQDEAPQAPPDAVALQAAFSELREVAAGIAAARDAPEISAAAAQLAAALAAFAERRGTDPAALQELGDALTGEAPALLADVREKLQVTDPLTIEAMPDAIRRDWIAPDGQVRLRVLPAENVSAPEAMQRFAGVVQAVAPAAYGPPASIIGASEAVLSAFFEAILYTIAAVALVITLLRRRASDVLLVLAPLAVASIWTVAASALFDLPFNFANVIVIPLLIGLGVAASVHIVVRAREVVHDAAGTHLEGTGVLDTSTPLAVLIAQLNTVAAFATLAVSQHRGLYSMGVLLGLAILFVLIVCLIVLPAFMVAVRGRAGAAPPASAT